MLAGAAKAPAMAINGKAKAALRNGCEVEDGSRDTGLLVFIYTPQDAAVASGDDKNGYASVDATAQ